MRTILLALAMCLATQAAEARTPLIVCNQWGCGPAPSWSQPEQRQHRQKHREGQSAGYRDGSVTAPAARVVSHPEGCPRRAFCGCGVAVKVFGRPIRELWLAANWFRYRTAEPAAGMVAVRHNHVFFILEVLGHGLVLAYDPNSGGHLTRIHVRSLAGFRVVDPRS